MKKMNIKNWPMLLLVSSTLLMVVSLVVVSCKKNLLSQELMQSNTDEVYFDKSRNAGKTSIKQQEQEIERINTYIKKWNWSTRK